MLRQSVEYSWSRVASHVNLLFAAPRAATAMGLFSPVVGLRWLTCSVMVTSPARGLRERGKPRPTQCRAAGIINGGGQQMEGGGGSVREWGRSRPVGMVNRIFAGTSGTGEKDREGAPPPSWMIDETNSSEKEEQWDQNGIILEPRGVGARTRRRCEPMSSGIATLAFYRMLRNK